MKQPLVIIFILNFIGCFGQEYSKKWNDINYAGDTMQHHNMDVYLPVTEKAYYPVIVLIYGSAWFSNNSKGIDMPILGKVLLDAGFAVITPNHRASWEAKFPSQVHDIKAVIRFIKANATQFQIDTSFIGITGSSSGGNLASMAGTTQFVKEFTLGNETIDIEGTVGNHVSGNSSVNAVVAWFPPTNMLVMDSCGGTDFIHDDAKSPASLYIGEPIQENKNRTLLASPTTYISSNSPPFLIFHGDKDRVVPYCQSELLHNALLEAGVSSKLVIVPEGGHGPGVHEEKYLKMMVDFLLNISTKTL